MRILTSCVALLLVSAIAAADPPKVGDTLALTGAPDWPALKWLYDSPSSSDAAGRVVVHWFCSPKVKACTDDLARVIALRDFGHVYVIAYIDGTQRFAKKLDPIRESEGVGRGTVAYGPGVTKLVKQLGITSMPTSIVVDVDGKVKAVTTSGDLNELDARDSLVKSLVGQIKEYTASHDGPAVVKIGAKFDLSIKIQLASWLSFKPDSPSLALTAPRDVQCTKATKIDGHTLVATATCSAPRGVYEVAGKLSFGYATPSGGDGIGEDEVVWKFEAK